MDKELNNGISRRDALKWIVKRTAETGALVAVNAIVVGYGLHSLEDKVKKTEDEAKKNLENGQALETKYFARDILHTSALVAEMTDEKTLTKAAGSALAGNMLIAYLLRNHPRWVNGVVGGLSCASARSVDLLSTLAFVKYFKDPRFREYGFDSYMGEMNPIFSQHPSETRVLVTGGVTIALLAFSGFRFRAFGRNYLGAVPFVAQNNYQGAHVLKLGLEIGDQVKGLISNGKDKEYIGNFLQKMQPEKKTAPIQTTKPEQT